MVPLALQTVVKHRAFDCRLGFGILPRLLEKLEQERKTIKTSLPLVQVYPFQRNRVHKQSLLSVGRGRRHLVQPDRISPSTNPRRFALFHVLPSGETSRWKGVEREQSTLWGKTER